MGGAIRLIKEWKVLEVRSMPAKWEQTVARDLEDRS